ncbi:uncharacterized protein LOC141903993 [Tubulanus polymorphus]|uniref:uncharacterized protein LOC141903993 n=1 Tax=Tubulanus polymorphus TaxID=672921 RepID=UPI003DA6A662
MMSKSRRLGNRMGGRSPEVRPVGAWVQPELKQDDQQYFEAVTSAQAEDERLQNIHRNKQEHLRRFQAEVKKRVKVIENAHKKQLIEKSYRAMKAERNILRQTMQASEKVMARKDRCCLCKDDSMKITTEENAAAPPLPDAVHKQKRQVRHVSTRARKTLLTKKIIRGGDENERKSTDLPGGPWWTSPTRDHPAQRSGEMSRVERLENRETLPETYENQLRVQNEVKKVHFNDDKPKKKKPIKEKSASQKDEVVVNVPELYPGVVGERMKQQKSSERAMYRRLFMDIEREQVKEMKKRRNHRERVVALKKSKEDERKRAEIRANRAIEPRDPVTGETAHEMLRTEAEDASEHVADAGVKQIDNRRYIDALKHRVREQIESKGLEIPLLCTCNGYSIWDTDPDHCANNCYFYRNHKGYTKALQTLLSTQV